jgi:hypothetical protein
MLLFYGSLFLIFLLGIGVVKARDKDMAMY